jgi:hypothetical protein
MRSRGLVRLSDLYRCGRLLLSQNETLLDAAKQRATSNMAIHNETLAAQRPPHPEPIYCCATGDEIPLYEPRKDRKDQRNI